MFRKITSQKPDRFPKPVRFEAGKNNFTKT
jgi:hypothetical protein